MAATSDAPASKSRKRFDHDGRPVFVLIPQNDMFARLCREAVLKQAGEEAPVVTTELQIYTVPSDAFLYVAREFKAPKGHTVQVSEPIDLSKDVYRADARKHRMLDEQALLQAVTKACNNVPGGKIYRAQLNGMRNDEPQSALLKITDL